mmetsp:Transcript_24294/g.24717  ORF Transcript_24294/g.24717 Transcript_24294/m.24717 type:complete len:202 (-) Transcript_24294:490-1095(-)
MNILTFFSFTVALQWHPESFSDAFTVNRNHAICRTTFGTKIVPTTHLSMSIMEEVTSEMKVAMRAKDTLTLNTIRGIRAAFINAMKEKSNGGGEGNDISDENAQNVLRKMAKMRKESIQMFTDGGAIDRADQEQKELEVIERWLPSLADEAQTRVWVEEALEQIGGDNNMGKVMGALMKAHRADIDGALAKKVVQDVLSSK